MCWEDADLESASAPLGKSGGASDHNIETSVSRMKAICRHLTFVTSPSITLKTCRIVQNVGSRFKVLNLRSNKCLCTVHESMLSVLKHVADQIAESKMRVLIN